MINDGVGAKGGSGMQEPGIPAETVTPRAAALKNPLALAYLGVFTSAAWARFGGKDITS